MSLLWAVAVASCGKKTNATCNTKLLKVCSLNGNACSGFVTIFFYIAVKIAMHSGPGSLHDISVQFTHFQNRSVK